MDGNFAGHYDLWIMRRIDAITSHYGRGWFRGKRVLEVGCGYAAIGEAMHRLGAQVTCSDARAEHLEHVQAQKPYLELVVHDMDDGKWPFRDDYDLIIHTGVLYHLKNYRQNLEHCLRSCRRLFLETEVLDSDRDEVLLVDENSTSYDQAFNGVGCRPSESHLENLLKANNCPFERCFDARLNANFHTYDWNIENTRQWRHGLRRAWFVQGRGGASLGRRFSRLITLPWTRSRELRRSA